MKNRLFLMAIVASCLLSSCSDPVKTYVHDELLSIVWQEQLLPKSVDEECSRVVSELNTFSKDSSDVILSIIAKKRTRLRELVAEWRVGSEAFELSDAINSLEPKVTKYKKHTNKIISDLQNSVASKSSEIWIPGETPTISYTDKEIGDMLLGTPKSIASPTANVIDSVATAIFEKCAYQTPIPKVTYYEYDKHSKIYSVRFDCADPLYFKAYKCEDGKYEYEFVSEDDSDTYSNSKNNEGRKSIKSGKADWDKVLDDYEKYVNQCISVYKKISNGDMNAMNSYSQLVENLGELSEKLENAEGEMTTSQANRYLKITQKLTSAVSDF